MQNVHGGRKTASNLLTFPSMGTENNTERDFVQCPAGVKCLLAVFCVTCLTVTDL